MGRYFSSFFITSLVYLLIFSSLLYSFNDMSKINSQTKQSEQKVKVTLIAHAKPEPATKPIEKKEIKKPKKKVVKEVVKKEKKLVKKVKKKPIEKLVKKIEKKLQKTKKEIVKTDIPKEVNKIQKTQIKQNKAIVKKQLPVVDTQTLTLKQNAYYAKIKQKIDQNKSYPRIAIKRAIEGDVKIKFTISQYGELLSFQILEGKRIFKKSIAKAIKKTFPIAPPKDIFTSNLDLSLTLQYKLY